MAGLRGPIAAIRGMQRQALAAASPAFQGQLAGVLGAASLKLVADEFRDSHDPYGQPWAPVSRNRKRDRRARARRAKAGKPARADKPLIDTGRLRAAATNKSALSVTGPIISITIPVEYASFHQYGTRSIARRQILPEASTGGLGSVWGDVLRKAADAYVRRHFQGGPDGNP